MHLKDIKNSICKIILIVFVVILLYFFSHEAIEFAKLQYNNYLLRKSADLCIKSIEELYENDGDKKIHLSAAYCKINNYNQAINLLQTLDVNDLSQNNTKFYYALYGGSLRKIKKYSEELKLYDELIKKYPTYGHFLKGEAYYKMENFKLSHKEFIEANDLDKKNNFLNSKEKKVLQNYLNKLQKK